MPVLILLLTALLTVVATTVPVLQVVLSAHHPDTALIVALLVSDELLVLVPAVTASVIASWPVDRPSPSARRAVRRWWIAAAAGELLGLAGFLTTAAFVPIPAWEVLAQLAVVAVVAVGLPRSARRTLQRRQRTDAAASSGPLEIAPSALRRIRRSMVLGGGIGLAVGLVLAVLELTLGEPAKLEELVRAIASPLGFAGLGIGSGGLISLAGIGPSITRILGDDYTTRRTIARTVIRGRQDLGLSPEDRARAAHFAAATNALLPYRLSSSTAIVVGALANSLSGLVEPDNRIGPVGPALLLLALVVAVPLALRQRRTVTRYIRDHPIPAAPGSEPTG